jgi:transposase
MPYSPHESEPTHAKSEEVSSTLDRHHSNYDELPYEQSTITARDSDF